MFSAYDSFIVHLADFYRLTFLFHLKMGLRHHIYAQAKDCAFCDYYNHNISQTIADDLVVY